MASTSEVKVVISAVDKASADIKKVGDAFSAQADRMKSVGQKMSAFITLPILGFGALALKESIAAEGALAKFNTVFADNAKDMLSFVDELRTTMPTARHEIVRMAADLQDLLVPLGITRDAATDLSKGFLEVANQIGAFNDVAPTEVLESIRAGIIGSSEPLAKFGIDARITSLETLALSEGLLKAGESFASLDPKVASQIRAQALYKQIVLQSSDAINGFEVNHNAADRRMKEVQATMQEIAVTLGNVLLPIVDAFLKKLIPIVHSFSELDPNIQKAIVAVAAFAAVLGPLLIIVGQLIIAVQAFSAALLFLAANPLILVGAGIVALIALIVLMIIHWDKVKAKVEEVWKAHGKTITAVLAVIAPQLNLLIGLLQLIIMTQQGVRDVVEEVWGAIPDFIKSGVASMIANINPLFGALKGILDLLNQIRAAAESVGGGGESGGGIGSKIRGLIPFAEGGIVTKPTPALVGEAGPEAIIPLSKIGRGSAPVNITIVNENPMFLDRDAGRIFGRQMMDQLKNSYGGIG